MKNLLFAFVLGLSVLLISCGGGDGDEGAKRVAKGPVYYGGTLRVNDVEDFKNLFPLSLIDYTSHHIANLVYEGLVQFDPKDLTIQPALAESYQVNEGATIYTFKLRKGVMFHDDPCFEGGKGREMKAADVKYCLDKVCASDPMNQGYFIFQNRVKGANEYYQSTLAKKPLTGGVSGITALDDYTIQIELVKPYSGLYNVLTMQYAWIYPKEAFDKYGMDMRIKCVGTGPFKIKDMKEGETVILERNPNYYQSDEHGNQLPYLDFIKYTFIKEKKAELLEFRKGGLDVVYQLPLEMIDEVVGELEEAKVGGNPSFQMQVEPSMAIQYLGFQHQNELFKNKKLRQAFNYAIDREALVNFTLKGDGSPAKFGYVPPFSKDYDNTKIKGYGFDPDQARKLLAEAGYPNGKGFPALELVINSGGTRYTQVAEVIQKMLKENLNIDIKLNIIPFAQHIENMDNGKSIFFRGAWLADYPDPENFLNTLYGAHVPATMAEKSYLNQFRFKSAEFDSNFKKSMEEVDIKKRMELLMKCEQIAIDEAAVMPLYYDENTWLISSDVTNCFMNGMNFYDFTRVYRDQKKGNAPKTAAPVAEEKKEE